MRVAVRQAAIAVGRFDVPGEGPVPIPRGQPTQPVSVEPAARRACSREVPRRDPEHNPAPRVVTADDLGCGDGALLRRDLSRAEAESPESSTSARGKMQEMKNPCIILDGGGVPGSVQRLSNVLSRSIYPYWREIWLERIERRMTGAAAEGGVNP